MKRLSLYFLAVFLSGAVVGGFGHWMYTANSVSAKMSPEEWRKRYLSEMETRLKLDSGQVTELNAVLDKTRERYLAEKARSKREMKEIHATQVEQVRGLLKPEQISEYEIVRTEREERRARENGEKR